MTKHHALTLLALSMTLAPGCIAHSPDDVELDPAEEALYRPGIDCMTDASCGGEEVDCYYDGSGWFGSDYSTEPKCVPGACGAAGASAALARAIAADAAAEGICPGCTRSNETGCEPHVTLHEGSTFTRVVGGLSWCCLSAMPLPGDDHESEAFALQCTPCVPMCAVDAQDACGEAPVGDAEDASEGAAESDTTEVIGTLE